MPVNSKRLRILSWNAQSIANYTKIFELNLLQKNEEIDVVCLQETFLNEDQKLFLIGYKIFRQDRNARGGGVAIAVKSDIVCKQVRTFETNHIENISVLLETNSGVLRVTSAYSPTYNRAFSDDIGLLLSSTDDTLVFGDFNARHTSWGCVNDNNAGIALFQTSMQLNLFILHAASPTHYPHSGGTPSNIDLLLTNTPDIVRTPIVLDCLSSDHRPIQSEIDYSINTGCRKFYDYRFAKWKRFGRIVSDRLGQLELSNDIDSNLNVLNGIILEARTLSIPLRVVRNNNFRPGSDTLATISYKNCLTRRWQRESSPLVRSRLKSLINLSKKLLGELIARDRNRSWGLYLEGANEDRKRFWKLSKTLRAKQSRASSLIGVSGDLIVDDLDKANAFSSVFEQAHHITANIISDRETSVLQFMDDLREREVDNDTMDLVSVEEIKKITAKLRPFKAPGCDGIVNILLKNLPDTAYEVMASIFNDCLTRSYWPESFKTAKVMAIPKPGKPRGNPSSYRPISLLGSTCKLFEKLVHTRLYGFGAEHNIFDPNQFGFRQQHSCSHQVLRVTNWIKENKTAKRSTGMVLFDIEKAFDAVWHDGLIYKLNGYGFPLYLCKLMNAFCRNRVYNVHVGDAKSRDIPIPAGLAQGSALSPLLYCLYVADLRLPRKFQTACYADDTAIFTSANRTKTICGDLQSALLRIEQYMQRWKIKINAAKTQAIVFPFNRQRKRQPAIQLKLNGSDVAFTNEVKYLGITLDRFLTFASHLRLTCTKVNKCLHMMYPMIGKRSKLTTRNRMTIFKTIVRPMLTYASPIWRNAANCHIKKLQILQNKCLKIIYRLPWRYSTRGLHLLSATPMIREFVDDYSIKFLDSCSNSDSDLIRALAHD